MGLYNDLTFSDTPYIPQYAGIPLEEARQTADKLAERHYQNLSRMSQLDLLARQQKTQVLPGHQRFIDDHIGQIKEALSDIAKTGGENATARVGAMVNQYMGDQNILNSIQRRGEVQKEIEAENALKAAGKMPVRKPGVRERFLSGEISPEELASPYQSTVEAYSEPVPEMEEILKVINPDQWYTGLAPDEKTRISKLIGEGSISPDMDLPMFYKTVTNAGISPKKIENLIDEAFSSYQLQPSYKQQTGLLGKSPLEMKRRLFNQALLRVFNQATPHYTQSNISDNLLKMGKQKPVNLEALPGETVQNQWGYNIDAFDPTKKGVQVATVNEAMPGHLQKIGEYEKQGFQSTYMPPTSSPGPGYYSIGTDTTSNRESHPKWPEFTRDAKAAAEIFDPSTAGWTDKQWEEYYKSPKASENVRAYQQEFEKRLSNSWLVPPADKKEAEQDAYMLSLQLPNRTLYDYETGKTLQLVDNNGQMSDRFKDLMEGSDWENKIRVTGRWEPKNFNTIDKGPEFYKAHDAYLWDAKEERYKRFLISPSAGELASYSGNRESVTSQLYAMAGKKPGTWQAVVPKYWYKGRYVPITSQPVELKEIYGNQRNAIIQGLPEEQRDIVASAPELIVAKVGGRETLFGSYEELADYLLGPGKVNK